MLYRKIYRMEEVKTHSKEGLYSISYGWLSFNADAFFICIYVLNINSEDEK